MVLPLAAGYILSACVMLPVSIQPDGVLVGKDELVPLVAAVDQARTESAQIIAELMEIQNNPDQAGSPAETHEFLTARLAENHTLVDSIAREIEPRPFANDEIVGQFKQIVYYHQQMGTFEDAVIQQLSQLETAQNRREFINRIFETDSAWTEFNQADENFLLLIREIDSDQAPDLEVKPYSQIFRERLAELRAPPPLPTGEPFGQLTYEFEVPELFSQTTVSVGWTGVPVDVLQFALQHPDGPTLHFKLAPLAEGQYIYDIPISRLPTDGSLVTIPSEVYPARDVFIQDARDATVGYEQGVVVIQLLPNDPVLAPLDGKWSLTVTAPVGLEIVFGAASVP